MKILSVIMLVIIFLTGCKKDQQEFTSEIRPDVPQNVEIDMDDDGISDFEIVYIGFEIFSTNTSEKISGTLVPLRDNKVLRRSDNPFLFLEDLSSIKTVVEQPLQWVGPSSLNQIICIQDNEDFLWPEKWSVNSSDDEDIFHIGLKLVDGPLQRLAWIRILVDKFSGDVFVIEKEIL